MTEENEKAVAIRVPTSREEEKSKQEHRKKKLIREDLSEEEKKKKEELELLITRLTDPSEEVINLSLSLLNTEIIHTSGLLSSSLLTLRVLKQHYNDIIEIHKKMPYLECKKKLSNMISALSATIGDENNIIKYIISGNKEDLVNYGHEYIKNVMNKLLNEYKNLKEEEITINGTTTLLTVEEKQDKLNHIYDMVNIIVPYCFKHKTEYEAVDLLVEVDKLNDILLYIDEESCDRVILYLLNMSHYCPSTDDYYRLMEVILSILKKEKRYIEYLKILLKLNRREDVKELIFECADQLLCKQIALVCARHGIYLEFSDEEKEKYKETLDLNELQTLSSGEHLSPFFLKLAKELEVEEPKLPEDVYKSHLDERRNACAWDSAKQNLSSTFVNAFVNAGFCKDKLMTVDSSAWIFKNKDHGIMSVTASMGLLLLWNVEEGLSQIDKFQYSSDLYIKSGALMAFGLVCSNIKNECDPAYALLGEHIHSANSMERIGAILGLGYAYAGTNREDMLEYLVPPLVDNSISVECSVFAAVSLGLIFVGSKNREVAEYITETVFEREKINNCLSTPVAKLYGVALGLLFLCCREKCETVISALDIVKHPIANYIKLTVEGLAFAGSNDVLKVQKMLQVCVEKRAEEHTSTNNTTVLSNTLDAAAGTATTPSPTTTPIPNATSNNAANTGSAAAPASTPERTAENNAVDTSSPVPSLNVTESRSRAPTPPRPTTTTTTSGHRTGSSTVSRNVGTLNVDNKKKSLRTTRETAKTSSTPVSPEEVLDQCVAILNIALIALTDDISTEMTIRTFDHFLQFANVDQKKAIPLAFALLFTSHPKPAVIDVLSKLTHDQDADTALHAIISLGLVGAGTNNSKIAVLLRQLASFYYKDSSATFVVRLAQGLLYMGKGLLTINPIYSNRSVINLISLGSLLVTIHALLQMKDTILGKYHYMLYYLVPCIYPRMLVTVDEHLEPLPVSVRVGQAVDVVAQAGKPKRITGFQTHTTPVLLSHTDKAELATEEYIPLNDTLEGVVILKKNPEYVPPVNM